MVDAAPGPELGHSGRQFLSSLISPHHAAGTELQTPSLCCLLAAACRVELETMVHPNVRNHGEGPYYGLLLVESAY